MQSTDNRPVEIVVVDTALDVEEPLPKRKDIVIDGKAYKPWQFQPGIAQNPGGRPKGATLKQRAREYLASLTQEEAFQYLAGLDKIDVWYMAEGRPTEDKNIKITVPQPILGGITQQIGDSTDNTQPS